MSQERAAAETDEQIEPQEPPPEPEYEGDVVEEAATPKPIVVDRAQGRRVLAAVFWLLASLAVLAGGVALWAHQTLLTSDGWGRIAEDVISHEEVTDAISVVLVDRLAGSLDVQKLVADAIPGPDFIAGAITGTVQNRITDKVAEFAQGDAFRRAFVNVNKLAHDAAMKAIRGGDSEALTSQDGVIAINIFPLIEGLLSQLQDMGVIDSSRQIPDLTNYEAPAAAVKLIETVLGRDIPDDVGTIVLVASDKLDLVQTVIRWFDAITILLLLLWAGCTALALWLSRKRVRMVLWLSGGAIAALLAGRFMTRLVLEGVSRRQPEVEARLLVNAIIDSAVDSLMWFTFVLMAIAVVVAIVAYVYERRDGRERASMVTPPRTLARWARDNALLILGIGLGVIVVMALWSVGGPGIAMLTAAAILLLVIGVAVLSDKADGESRSSTEG